VNIALINSCNDPAGKNIRSHIEQIIDSGKPIRGAHHIELVEVEGRLIEQDRIDRKVDADTICFLSRHVSQKPEPVLTVHVSGNFSHASLGGRPGILPPAAPGWMHAVLRGLSCHAPAGYRVSYESTHHGPTELETPSFFVEIGSTEDEWIDEAAGEAVAESVINAEPVDTIDLIGLGGTHYCQRQTQIALTTRGAFGHIAPSRVIPDLGIEQVRRMQEQTGAVAAYIDRKALSTMEIRRLEQILTNLGITRLWERDLASIGDLSWSTFRVIIEMALSVESSATCHIHRMRREQDPEFFEINRELLDEARKADEQALLMAFEPLPFAHISTPKRSILPIFITGSAERSQVLHDLITLCVTIISYKEKIAIEGDQLTIHKKRFDPLKARELGVTEGPLCGDLMKGHEVRIGDRVIVPEMVQKTMVKKIRIPGLENVTYEVNRRRGTQ
jgi:D-aminoacyl-tRNA deacylase